MHERYYSIDSNLIIERSDFKEGLERIKRMDRSFHNGGRDEIQNSRTFGEALYKLGWSARYSSPPGFIRGLNYIRSNIYDRDSRFVLYVIAKIVQSGGYIKFVDSHASCAKIYKFNSGSLKQEFLEKKYIDINSDKDLLDLLEFSIENLSMEPQDIISLIKQKYINDIMES